ncbi:MAG TPA: hypothetical protein VLA52_03070 [Thermohalobaculum sp.]|nr:hypothetical protein [Thermohalobaculum sp.]
MMIGRNIRTLLVLLAVVSLPLFWLFRPVDQLPARFAAGQCHRIALTDAQTGRLVVGVGDMELLSDGDTLILAASDRLALDRNPGTAPSGGLYQVSMSRLAAGDVYAMPILSQETAPGGLFPQALTVSPDGEQLAFVNHDRDGTVGIIGGRYGDGTFSPRYARTGNEFCRARDVQFSGDGEMGVLAVLDRASCNFSLADLDPGAATGRIVAVDLAASDSPTEVTGGLAEARGIAGTFVSEMRLSRLHDRLGDPIQLPGGPDRLTWDQAGGLVAALHPSLPRTLTLRYGFAGSAPSRIVRVDLDRRVEVLFDDTEGEIFSAASVGVLSRGILAAGSEFEPGILLCRASG